METKLINPVPDAKEWSKIIHFFELTPFYFHFISILFPFYLHFTSILFPFYFHFIFILFPFYLHFTSILSPFYVHFTSILFPFYFHFISILFPFYLHFTSILCPFYVHFTSILFPFIFILCPFYFHFISISSPFFTNVKYEKFYYVNKVFLYTEVIFFSRWPYQFIEIKVKRQIYTQTQYVSSDKGREKKISRLSLIEKQLLLPSRFHPLNRKIFG